MSKDAALALVAALAIVTFTTVRADAQTNVPFPKPRPREFSSPQPPKAPPSAPPPSEQDLDPDPVLTGSNVERRERIRICGGEWLKMKKSGAAFGKDWRDFSRECYARPLPPAGAQTLR